MYNINDAGQSLDCMLSNNGDGKVTVDCVVQGGSPNNYTCAIGEEEEFICMSLNFLLACSHVALLTETVIIIM